MAPTVFVTTATGTQGSAVSRQLLELGWTVRGTTRTPDSPSAQAVAAKGVNLTTCDWDDEAALTTAITGCDMLFLNMMPNWADMSSERVHAKRILDIAKVAGVRHVVYSSGVTGAGSKIIKEMDPGNPVKQTVESKGLIRDMVREAGFETWTILQPANFMANFFLPKVSMYGPAYLETNTWKTAMLPTTKLPLIDHEDIARFAVAAFQDPAHFHAKTIPLAGDRLTPGECMAALGKANGRAMAAEFYSDEEIEAQKAGNPFVLAQMCLRDMDGCIDWEGLKAYGVPMTKFDEFLEREAEQVKATYP